MSDVLKKTVDLTKIPGRVYVGRTNGEKARVYFQLDDFDNYSENIVVEVIFPDNARTLTSSFFLGMFGESVRKAGNKSDFFRKYKIRASDKIRKEVEIGVNEALSAWSGR